MYAFLSGVSLLVVKLRTDKDNYVTKSLKKKRSGKNIIFIFDFINVSSSSKIIISKNVKMVELIHDDKKMCEKCDFKENSESIMEMHILEKHVHSDTNNLFNCDECDYSFKEKTELFKHLKEKHQGENTEETNNELNDANNKEDSSEPQRCTSWRSQS